MDPRDRYPGETSIMNPDEFEGEMYYPDTLWNRLLFRQGKRIPTDEELDARDRARMAARDPDGRDDIETFHKQLRKSFRRVCGTVAFYLIAPTVSAAIARRHLHVQIRYLLLIFVVALLSFLLEVRVTAVRRLHDVGESGWLLVSPWKALRALKLPSGPPNQWGDGTT